MAPSNRQPLPRRGIRYLRHRLARIRVRFESDIKVFDRGGDVPAVCFSGITPSPVAPLFEMVSTTQQLGLNAICVRDVRDLWYQQGLRGAKSPEATAALLAQDLYGDDRWPEYMSPLYEAAPEPVDVKEELVASPLPVEIWFSAGHRIDVAHARILRPCRE